MPALVHQRCFSHSLREAAARCPDCGRYFCRECVTEHNDRLICAACLRQHVNAPMTRRRGFVATARSAQVLAGLLTAWICFYFLGRLLVSMPDDFHEGTLWKSTFLGETTPRAAAPGETGRE